MVPPDGLRTYTADAVSYPKGPTGEVKKSLLRRSRWFVAHPWGGRALCPAQYQLAKARGEMHVGARMARRRVELDDRDISRVNLR